MDLVFAHGCVITMDPALPEVEAIAVSRGRIAALGTSEEMLALKSPGTEVVDLEGHVVLPGFVEAHGHPTIGMSFRNKGVIDVRPAVATTAEEVLDIIGSAIAAAPAGVPLTVVGWEELLRRDLPDPTVEYLDRLAPENPFAILHNSAHSAWGNTLALAAAGVDGDTPDPEGSWFVRDEDGDPTGRAEELPATLILAGEPLSVTPELAPALLADEYAAYSAAGVTTVGELAFDPELRDLFVGVAARSPQVRVRAYRMSNRPQKVRGGPESDPSLFREVGVKLWADGSPWVGTIAASFPYLDNSVTRQLGFAGERGCCNYSYDDVRTTCVAALTAGEQVAIHAQGDAAVDLVLDAVTAALAEVPREDHRLRLEHCCLMTPAQYQRAARLGVTCSLFVAHIRYWGDAVVNDLFGERGNGWTAARSALDAGVRISLHNDVPVTPSEPLRNVQVAVTRRTAVSGTVLGADEAITLEEALRAVTIDAAWQLFSDHEVGSIENGKLADLVILADDPRTVDPEKIGDIAVVATYLSGRRVHPSQA